MEGFSFHLFRTRKSAPRRITDSALKTPWHRGAEPLGAHAEAVNLALMPTKGLFDGFRVFGSNLEKRFGRTVRVTSSLLPIAKGSYAHSDHERELVLRLLELLSNCLHILWREYEFPIRLSLTAKYAAALTDTLNQLIKVFRVHLNSCRTAFARIRFWCRSATRPPGSLD
jgi:hypothetical protein